MTTFFTADHHFDHKNIIEYCKRPFDSVRNMDATLISNWNIVVKPTDIVYHLGDFTLGGIDKFVHYAENLNGIIKIIPGGHDWRWLKHFTEDCHFSASSSVVEVLPPLVSVSTRISDRHKIIVLCHYAMRVWDRSHRDSWHLYGHSHGKLLAKGNSLDVGVDTNDFTPVSLEQIEIWMKNLPNNIQNRRTIR